MTADKTLKRILVKQYIFLAILPLVGLNSIFIIFYSNSSLESISRENVNVAKSVAADFEDHMRQPVEILRQVSGIIDSTAIVDPGEMNDFLKAQIAAYGFFESIFIIDDKGKIKYAGLSPGVKGRIEDFVGMDLSKVQFLRNKPGKGSYLWSDTFFSLATGDLTVTVTIPSKNGMIAGNINLRKLCDISGRISSASGRTIYLVDRQGRVIAHSDNTMIAAREDLSALEIIKGGLSGKTGTFTYYAHGSRKIGSVAGIPVTGWLVVAEQPTAVAYRNIYVMEVIFLFGLLITVLAAVIAARKSLGGILKPVDGLVGAVERIAKGDYDTSSFETGFKEVEVLARHFKDMAQAVKVREEELLDRNEELQMTEEMLRQQVKEYDRSQTLLRHTNMTFQGLVQASPLAIIVIDTNGNVSLWNRAAEKIFGWTEEEIVGRPYPIVPESDKADCSGMRSRVLQGHSYSGRHVRRQRKDGSLVDVSLSGAPLFSDADKPVGAIAIIEDISEKKRTEEQLRHSQEEMSTLLESISDAFIAVDKEWRFTYVNAKAELLLRRETGSLLGKNFLAEFPAAVSTTLHRNLQQAVATQIPAHFEDYYTPLAIWLEIRMYPYPEGLSCFIRDITERKQAETALAWHARSLEKLLNASREFTTTTEVSLLYRKILENAENLLALDFSSVMLFNEDRSRLMLVDSLGFPAEEINSFSLSEGEGLAMHVAIRREPDVVNDFAAECRFVTPTMVSRFGIKSAIAVPMILEDETFGALIGHCKEARYFSPEEISIYQNIANQAAMAIRNSMTLHALKGSEAKYRDLFENANDAIFIVNADLQYVDVNRKACELLGFSREELLSMRIPDLLPEEQIPRSEEEFKILRSKGSYQQFVGRLRKKDGSFIHVEVSASAIYEGGKVVGSRDILRDISDRIHWAEEISRLNAELEQRVLERTAQLEAANRELESFSYSVSHDLRAPLRHINGFSKALLEDYGDKLDDQGKYFIQRLRVVSRQMGELIDDLLKLSSLSRSEVRKISLHLDRLARAVVRELNRSYPDREIEVQIEDDLPCEGDPHLLKVVLENLLSNAWKYTGKTEKPLVEVGATDIDGKCTFFVRDNGVGFDMRYANKLFGAFQRLHRADEFEGTGIGLATVQRIIHRHGGRVWAYGEEGKGATFYFTLGD